jgi:CHAD domain-containing protein
MTRAVAPAADDPELVHKLRVEVRRAVAAVEAFAEYLPRRVYRQAKRELRSVRRAAGSARDWDVFAAGVGAWAVGRPEAERPGLDAVLGWAAARRHAAQAALDELAQDHLVAIEQLRTEVREAVRRPRDTKGRTLGELVRRLLTERTAELTAAVTADITTDADLHRVRIAAKRVRYTAEVLDDWLPPGVGDDLYPRLKEVQEALGRFNDAVTALAHLDEFAAHLRRVHPDLWERCRPAVEALSAHHIAAREHDRVAFRHWAEGWRNRGGGWVTGD